MGLMGLTRLDARRAPCCKWRMQPPSLFPLHQPPLSRRSFLRQSSSLAAAALGTGCAAGSARRYVAFPAYPFALGVASGDPAPDGFVIWTRLAPEPLAGGGMPATPVKVSWVVAEDQKFSKVAAKGVTVARPEWGHSVHVEVAGLKPDRWYWYRFETGHETSPLGRTRTTPAPGVLPERFRFAFASCQHYETGYYNAYQHMLRENIDLVVHLGDYIYENAGRDGLIRKHVGGELMTLDDYRNRLAQYRTDLDLQTIHAAVPWLVTWDDHEVDNNYASDISEQANVSPAALLQRRAAAYQAYYEHMPLRRSSLPSGPDMQLYRRVSIGGLADFHVLDTRQYRTDQPCGDGRSAPCAESLSPGQTLLGARQRDWLLQGLASSRARWNILAQQVMMARVDRTAGPEIAYSMDQWPGYEMERRQLLDFFGDRPGLNPVVLTGDIHSNWANELTRAADPDHEHPVAAEFVGTSITSGGDGTASPGHLLKTLAENPFVKFHNAERGYVKCELTAGQWRTDYRTVQHVTRRNTPVNTRASFILEAGSSKLQSI